MIVHVLLGDQWVSLGALVEFLDLGPADHVVVRGPADSPKVATCRPALMTSRSGEDGHVAITREALDAMCFAWRLAANTPADLLELVGTGETP